MEPTPELTSQQPVVPKELGGKWLAWTLDGSRIVASGDSLLDCEAAAKRTGVTELRFEKTPRPDVRLVGVVR